MWKRIALGIFTALLLPFRRVDVGKSDFVGSAPFDERQRVTVVDFGHDAGEFGAYCG